MGEREGQVYSIGTVPAWVPPTLCESCVRPALSAGGASGVGVYYPLPPPTLDVMAKAAASRRSRRPAARTARLVFARTNYLILVASVALVVVGYVLMRVENAVDGFLSLYVAPLLILGGYLGVIAAILWRPKEADEETA